MSQDDKKSKAKRDAIGAQINNARLAIVSDALMAFVESIDNRVPSDDEILAEGLHMQFAYSPLATFEKDKWRFAKYFCWRRKHLVALDFLVESSPLELQIVRVHDDEWPPVVRRFVHNHYASDAGAGLHEGDDPNAGEEWKKGE